MSTKGTHIPDWLQVPFAGITPAPTQDKGQDLFPTGNWRAIRPVYRDKMPPCNNACGTNEKIQGYLDLVKRGKYLDAYALIKEDMPFPSVTGRVCYHPCEQACNRGNYDEAISIRAVEPFLRDIGMGTSKVRLGPRVAVIGGGNTAIDCAREALRQGAEEVTMITVESNTSEMPAVPEDLHDMLEEGVELLHGLAMTAVLGNGKVEALQLHPARFSGAINASPIATDREAAAERFAVDNVIIAVGQHASLAWLPNEFKNERGTIAVDRFGRLGNTNFFAAGDIVQLGSGQPLMVVNAVGDGKRVAFNLHKVLSG